jgi:membrane protease YdiL (CAAX protease family)
MDIITGLSLNVLLPLVIVLVMHFRIGSYPEPFPKSPNKRREIIEVIAFYLLAAAVSSIYIFRLTTEQLSHPTAAVQLGHVGFAVIPFLIAPLAYVVLRQKWTRVELGLVLPRSKPMVVFALALFGFAGVLPFIGGVPEPLPWAFIAIAVYQPAFIEEFFFRVIIQGKLERALGQNKAWFYSGILFGLMHVPVDFFGPQFYANGANYLNSSVLLISQIISGWMFGIIYSKTRSILPGMAAHFMADFRLGAIIMHILH